MDKGLEQTFFQRQNTKGQEVHEKVLDINNHHRKANQKLNDVSRHTCLSDYYQNKDKERPNAWKHAEEKEHLYTVGDIN